MWSMVLKSVLTYLVLPLVKYTVGWAWDLYQTAQENKKLKQDNEALAKKLKEAKGEQAIDAFNNMP